MSEAVWILIFLTTAGQPYASEPMTLQSCGTLLARPEFKEAFCLNTQYPALRAYAKRA